MLSARSHAAPTHTAASPAMHETTISPIDSKSPGTAQAAASQTVRALLGLRELILGGELAAGARISELWVVERLGVSRTPVRAALIRLQE